MHLSMWSNFLINTTPEDAVRILAAHDWRHAELSTEHGTALLERGNPKQAGRAFKEFCGDHNLAFDQGHLLLQADIAHPDENTRIETVDTLKRWCDLFIACGVNAAVLHPGGKLIEDDAERLDIRRKSLEILLQHCSGTNFAICLENCRQQANSASEILEILKPFTEAQTGICFDTGHLNLGDRDFAGFLHTAGKRLRALHIADNMGQYDDHLFPYSTGTIPWDVVLDGLRAISYDGLFNFEVPGETRCPEDVRLAKLDYALQLGRTMVKAGQSPT